jgi:prepilin-type N-terminal cleavage/methylation domain-containing protein
MRSTTDPRGRRSGFTLVEILVVMFILVTLAGLVMVIVGPADERARIRSTEALIRRLKLHLEEYKGLMGNYPPDGIDFAVRNDKGEPVRGSASLHFHLTKPLIVTKMIGGETRKEAHPPIATFGPADLTEEHEDYPGVREIKDAFGVPIHYDNTEDGRFRPQGAEVHYGGDIDERTHPPDPRSDDSKWAPKPGSVQSIGYDLWSHGKRGHDRRAEDSEPIANWNLAE